MRGAKRIIGVDLNQEKREIGTRISNKRSTHYSVSVKRIDVRILDNNIAGKRLGVTDFINPNDIGGKTVSEVHF